MECYWLTMSTDEDNKIHSNFDDALAWMKDKMEFGFAVGISRWIKTTDNITVNMGNALTAEAKIRSLGE